MEEQINIDFMQNEASFWVMLDGFLANTEISQGDSNGYAIKKQLRRVAGKKIAQLSRRYDEIKSD